MIRTTLSASLLAATLALLASPFIATDAAAQDVGLRSVNYPDRLVRHRNFQVELSQIASDQPDARFKLVGGLSGGGTVSFESVNFPGYYLRHQNFGVMLQANDGSDLFRRDSSFFDRGALGGRGRSFEASNFPGYFLRHQNFVLRLGQNDQSPLFAQDASFEVVQNRSQSAACFWLQSGPAGRWQAMPQFSNKQACFAQDSCDGGLGQSGGGCYKWADSADAPAQRW